MKRRTCENKVAKNGKEKTCHRKGRWCNVTELFICDECHEKTPCAMRVRKAFGI